MRLPVVNHTSEVQAVTDKVLITFHSNVEPPEVVWIDRATASRLIRQLQRVLDDSYNDMINQRPERDASKDYSSGY